MTRKAKWMVPAAVMAASVWWVSLSMAGAERERAPQRERAEQRERGERRERRERAEERERDRRAEAERDEREAVRELEEAEHDVHETTMQLERLQAVRTMAFEPELAALLAIGAMRDELDLAPKALAEQLEGVLKQTRTLGLRNAIRLALRECYEEGGEKDKLLGLLKDTIAENDKAIQDKQVKAGK